MPKYIDPRGHSTFGIGICARCSKKYSLDELHPDPNASGLMCCANGCIDQYDPYRLAPKTTEDIVLMWARPDVQLYPGPVQVPINRLQAAIQVREDNYMQQAIVEGGSSEDILEAQPDMGIAADYPTFLTQGPSGIMGADTDVDEGVAAAPPVSQYNVNRTWAPNRYYTLGSTVCPVNPVGMEAVGMVLFTFVAIVPGLSGATAPAWTTVIGTPVIDNGVVWLNQGEYSP